MPNSVSATKEAMLAAIGADTIEELYEQIPAAHRLQGAIELPPAIPSEVHLSRHLRDLLERNQTCRANLSFLGAGCWPHYVPAICDEIATRSEFTTNIWGTPSSDHGRNQALFEFCSQIGELVDMDCVGLPVYSWGCAAGHAIRIAARLTGRRRVLVPASIDPERLAVIRTYCEPVEMRNHLELVLVDFDDTGQVSLADLTAKLSDDVAAVYVENPSYLGIIESRLDRVCRAAQEHGAEMIVGVDPSSLGILRSPGSIGADLAVGTIQPLGLHMHTGGTAGGFISSRDDARYVLEYPTLLLSATSTTADGELGFAMTLLEQSSYDARENGKDWTGHTVHLWGITSAVYMALMGPEGFVELGETILQLSHYAARHIGEIPDVRVRFPQGFFKEFVVNFDDTARTVTDINRRLRAHGIFGGKDLSRDFPTLGQSALYCVTEAHTADDIDRLTRTLEEVLA
jgi:glycine dehydrogenase subunit 1